MTGTYVEPSESALPVPFDGYEIHGVIEEDGSCEIVPDARARFWSLYGHIPGRGVECIGDFQTRELAEEVLARITGRPCSISTGKGNATMKPLTDNDRRAMRLDHVLTWCRDWNSGREGLIDLLTDARHWCDRHGESFAALDRRAHQDYLAKRHEEPQHERRTEP